MLPPRSLALLATLLLAPSTHAVIVAGLDGTQNITAPGVDDFGFAHVGLVWDTTDGVFASGTYLGSGWVLSAYHAVRDLSATGFAFGNVFFGGTPYSVDAGSAVRLAGGTSDLALFQLSGPHPALPALSLSLSTPLLGSSFALAGAGRNRATGETHWDVNTATHPDTWTGTGGPGDEQGYAYAPGATLRWGTNARTIDPVVPVNDGFGITAMFRTAFDSGVADEAQAAPGDSGGGVFFKNGGAWELAGLMLATATLDGQPGETAVYGNQSFIADLATYRAQIVSIVPEPGAAGLLTAGLGLLALRRRRA